MTAAEPLSHDGFIFLSELQALGGKASRQLLTAAVEKRGIKDIDSVIFELQKSKWIRPYSFNTKQLTYSFAHSKKHLFKNASHYSRDTKQLIGKAVRNSNANYRAVVDGKKPRHSPLHVYAERCLSRQDTARFWREVEELDDRQLSDLTDRVARLLGRGS